MYLIIVRFGMRGFESLSRILAALAAIYCDKSKIEHIG
jgi:hypothetical protein